MPVTPAITLAINLAISLAITLNPNHHLDPNPNRLVTHTMSMFRDPGS